MYIVARSFIWLKKKLERIIEEALKAQYNFPASVRFYNPLDTVIKGLVIIGEGSYINSGRLLSGEHSRIVIGDNCAIGHNVTLSSVTHDPSCPTGRSRRHIEADITIGSNVWIGSNVFIREGVSIGDNCIIGANSVVTKSFDKNLVIGGVPARVLREVQISNEGIT